MKILIVDDEYLIRNWLKLFIGQTDIEVKKEIFEASNGEEAIKILHKTDIDLIITDIKMPIVDGIELIEFVVRTYPNITIGVLSAYSDLRDVKLALKKGASDYILKAEMQLDDINRLLKQALNSEQSNPVDSQFLSALENQRTLSACLEDKSINFDQFLSALKGPSIENIKRIMQNNLISLKMRFIYYKPENKVSKIKEDLAFLELIFAKENSADKHSNILIPCENNFYLEVNCLESNDQERLKAKPIGEYSFANEKIYMSPYLNVSEKDKVFTTYQIQLNDFKNRLFYLTYETNDFTIQLKNYLLEIKSRISDSKLDDNKLKDIDFDELQSQFTTYIEKRKYYQAMFILPILLATCKIN